MHKALALKTYNQNCGLAAALDVIGDRWTLLIIRTLLAGPARFGDLQAQLPGIGANLLSARLKSLARHHVIEKLDEGRGGYVLTSKGEALRPIVQALGNWGRSYLPIPGGYHDARWTMFNIEAAFRPERAEGIDAVVNFFLGEKAFHLNIRKRSCRAIAGPAPAPDVSISAQSEQLLGAQSRLQITGDTAVYDRIRPCFDL